MVMNLRIATAWATLMVVFSVNYADDPPKTKKPKQPVYEFRDDHDPDGIGKFYMGREIAQVMGYEGWSWLERPEREKEEHCTKMLESLKLKKGDAVADIGAGSGFYTFAISLVVGAKGRVYAVDVQPQMINLIRQRLRTWKT